VAHLALVLVAAHASLAPTDAAPILILARAALFAPLLGVGARRSVGCRTRNHQREQEKPSHHPDADALNAPRRPDDASADPESGEDEV